MSAAERTERMAETSPRFMARMAGVFYLMDFAFAPAMFAGSKFVVPGDAAVTATFTKVYKAKSMPRAYG